MSRRVLVPLDKTERADGALKALADVCEKGDEVILLSIAEAEHGTQTGVRPGRTIRGSAMGLPAGGGAVGLTAEMPVYAETSDQTMQRQLDDLQGFLTPVARKLEAEGFLVQMAFEIGGQPAEAIVDVARRVNPTFILMTRTTKSGIAQRVFGTVAQHVIREDVAPVMIIPAR